MASTSLQKGRVIYVDMAPITNISIDDDCARLGAALRYVNRECYASDEPEFLMGLFGPPVPRGPVARLVLGRSGDKIPTRVDTSYFAARELSGSWYGRISIPREFSARGWTVPKLATPEPGWTSKSKCAQSLACPASWKFGSQCRVDGYFVVWGKSGRLAMYQEFKDQIVAERNDTIDVVAAILFG